MSQALAVPAEFQRRTIIAVVAERGGCNAEFDCGHTVWFAMQVERGDRFYCSACVTRGMNTVRAECDRANVATAAAGRGIASAIADIEAGRV